MLNKSLSCWSWIATAGKRLREDTIAFRADAGVLVYFLAYAEARTIDEQPESVRLTNHIVLTTPLPSLGLHARDHITTRRTQAIAVWSPNCANRRSMPLPSLTDALIRNSRVEHTIINDDEYPVAHWMNGCGGPNHFATWAGFVFQESS